MLVFFPTVMNNFTYFINAFSLTMIQSSYITFLKRNLLTGHISRSVVKPGLENIVYNKQSQKNEIKNGQLRAPFGVHTEMIFLSP